MIDFPSNPTNGQVYGNWIYDSSITAWRNVNTDTGIGTLNAMGLKNVVPTSVQVGSGSSTTNANGLVTFTGASSVSLNEVFTGTYTNYKIIVDTPTTTGNGAIGMRGRIAGVDNSSSSYYSMYHFSRANGVGADAVVNSTYWFLYNNYTTSAWGGSAIDLQKPKLSAFTQGPFAGNGADSTSAYAIAGSLLFLANNSFDGLTLLPTGAGTMTGTVQVYGYTN